MRWLLLACRKPHNWPHPGQLSRHLHSASRATLGTICSHSHRNNSRRIASLSPGDGTTTGQEWPREFPYKAEDTAELIDKNDPASTSVVRLAAMTEKITK